MGTVFGEDYPELWEDQVIFSKVATDYLNPGLNDLASEHGVATYGESDAWTPEQLKYLMPYLQELADIAGQGALSAMLLRRSMWNDDEAEPPGTRLSQLRNLAFREEMLRGGTVPKDTAQFIEDLARRPVIPVDEVSTQAAVAGRLEKMGEDRLATVRPPRPDPQPYGVSHEGAEHWCASWMRYLGALDAQVTVYSGDGGVDIIAENSGWEVQVKNYLGAVGVVEVRELVGISYVHGRKPMLFTSGTLTSDAVAFAEEAGVAVFSYDVIAGTLTGLNSRARQLRSRGFSYGERDGDTDSPKTERHFLQRPWS